MNEMPKTKDIATTTPNELVLTDDAIQYVKNAITMCENLVREVLKPDIDFGKTPGIEYPYLWDSGAAKLMAAFNAYPTYKILDTIDSVSKTAYTVQCELVARNTGKLLTVGLGSCSTTEKRYRYLRKDNQAEAEGIPNTILKMAAKRADIDAVHSLPGVAGTLRKLFTRGLPDSLTETARLFAAKLNNLGITIEQAREMLGIRSFREDWIKKQHKTLDEAYEVIKAAIQLSQTPKETVNDNKGTLPGTT